MSQSQIKKWFSRFDKYVTVGEPQEGEMVLSESDQEDLLEEGYDAEENGISTSSSQTSSSSILSSSHENPREKGKRAKATEKSALIVKQTGSFSSAPPYADSHGSLQSSVPDLSSAEVPPQTFWNKSSRYCSGLWAEGRKRLPYYVPVIGWLPHYQWKTQLLKDTIAGISVGLLLIPQCLAYA